MLSSNAAKLKDINASLLLSTSNPNPSHPHKSKPIGVGGPDRRILVGIAGNRKPVVWTERDFRIEEREYSALYGELRGEEMK